MADFFKNVLGGGMSSSASAAPSADADFADFADAPSPSPIPFEPVPGGATLSGPGPAATGHPYTKWYNIHERHSLKEFKAEGVILALIVVIFTLHFVGTRRNKAKAAAWIKANSPALKNEFAIVGFNGVPGSDEQPEALLKEKSLFEYASYATGRQNVAFMDVKLTLKKRFNPVMLFIETGLGFLYDSFASPEESAEAIIYPFDGKESQIVPGLPGAAELRSKDSKSTYDGFVWAIVHKDKMKKIRDDRYDVSITFTKDNSKLPLWLTVMSESAEITDTLLTKELAAAVEKAGDLFESLIITDQPIDKPIKHKLGTIPVVPAAIFWKLRRQWQFEGPGSKFAPLITRFCSPIGTLGLTSNRLEETIPRKRIYLKHKLPASNNYDDLVPLFSVFLRIPDHLATSAHFRPEVQRKVKSVRDEAKKDIERTLVDEKAEERAAERDRAKKAKRDADLSALDAKAQKKYLDREKEKQQRKASKKQTVRA